MITWCWFFLRYSATNVRWSLRSLYVEERYSFIVALIVQRRLAPHMIAVPLEGVRTQSAKSVAEPVSPTANNFALNNIRRSRAGRSDSPSGRWALDDLEKHVFIGGDRRHDAARITYQRLAPPPDIG